MAPSADIIDDLMPSDEDLLYEEELLRNPFAIRLWIRYIDARRDSPSKKRFLLYERSLQKIPGSYKLWHRYLQERSRECVGLDKDALNNCYERALVTMHKMPRVWVEYIESLISQGFVTRTRRTLDRALAALPVTQHDRIWVLYLRFITQPGMPMDTAFRVYRRYLKMEPGHREEYIAYLLKNERWGEAAAELAVCVNDDTFRSLEGKSKHTLWLELCDIITKHPEDVRHLNIDAIIRGGIRKFTNEVGRLWCALADYYIRLALFERARDVYQEGVESVMTVRDFTLIFEALTSFEQALAEAQMAQMGDAADAAAAAVPQGDGADFLLADDGVDIDLRLERLDWLYEERPKLLNSVMLRQNPHNVQEWHKRVRLFEKDPHQQIQTYTEAVKTVHAEKAVGKPHTLWCAFAHFYEKHGDLDNARAVFRKATQVADVRRAVQARFVYVDDLSHVWVQWAEMEVRHNQVKRALEVLMSAVEQPIIVSGRMSAEQQKTLPPQAKIHRNQRIWSMYVDLVEALGTFDEAREVYDRMIDNKVASAQAILNYAEFLQQQKFWEDSFQVYEKGIANFRYPHVERIWKAYLTAFVDRHKGGKVERARDLFIQACEEAPPEKRKQFFLMHADFEEKFGLARHCFTVYERAAKGVPKEERVEVFRLFADRAQKLSGIPKVREVYQMACEAEPPNELPDKDVLALSLEFITIERRLQEIDRARAIFVFASAMADERKFADFWSRWEEFEGQHGNPNTWREMTRLRRSVAAANSAVHFNTTNVEAAVQLGEQHDDPMAALEAEATQQQALPGFVTGGVQGGDAQPAADEPQAKRARVQNPEEIDLGDDDDE